MSPDDNHQLPSVCGQRRLTALAQPGTVLLQTGEHDHVAVIELSAAEARRVACAGILALLLRGSGRRRHHDKRNDKEKTEHLRCLRTQR